MSRFTRYQIATALAIFFHLIGLVGIAFVDRHLFASATSLNLLLMFILIIYTQHRLNAPFLIFAIACIVTGFVVELIGTRTGLLFGEYSYGEVLGPKALGIPFIIGINWFIIMYCCGATILAIFNKLTRSLPDTEKPRPVLKMASVVSDGALLAVFFDWIMEPVAVELGYWTWLQGDIPIFNYVCWFLVSAFLLMIFHICRFEKENKFAVNLLLIQLMFFLVLRSLL